MRRGVSGYARKLAPNSYAPLAPRQLPGGIQVGDVHLLRDVVGVDEIGILLLVVRFLLLVLRVGLFLLQRLALSAR